jgi:hypothetical protein
VARLADQDPWYVWLGALFRGNLMPLGALASLIILVGTIAVLGHGARDGNGSSAGGASETRAKAPAAPESDSAGSAQAPSTRSASPAAAAPDAAVAPPRAVRRSAEVTLSTTPREVEHVSDEAIRVTDALGGFVQTSSVSSGGEGETAGAELTLRVPSARLSDALTQLSRLAHVKHRSQQAEDLTDQRSALRAAVTDARAERDGLRTRLARAETDTERARLRGQLQRAEQLIVTRKRRLASLDREVSYSTVDVEVTGDRRSGAAAAPSDGHWTPGDALRDAGRVLEVSAGVLLVGLAVLVPLGLVGALAAVAVRLTVRRRRERAVDAA